ncbi:DUF1800 family protein [Pseudoalteromonas sp. S16_S37]|uniref:DUF1800 family protein n=1 Tax=Pseudoalteromonas sp. S16_S37 TaxID=2720228 RepID=UPI0016809334|nr:DUF1800 family protein [Pseudoalteromonas sp. S16_S37]MBD1584352.1 DUF1800 domain-containing protein [Pseudoalteromonas sp. S16_S37]
MSLNKTFYRSLCYLCLLSALVFGSKANSVPISKLSAQGQEKNSLPSSEQLITSNLDNGFSSPDKVVRLLQQATFGAKPSQIQALTGTSASSWFKAQLKQPANLLLPKVISLGQKYRVDDENAYSPFYLESTSIAFWQNTITGEDQLRQRMAFALSQILVVSNAAGDEISEHPEMVASYQDILIKGAFGN